MSSGGCAGRLARLAAGALLAAAVLAATAYGTLRMLTAGASVEVPDVSGRPLVDALRLTQERGLTLMLQREDPSAAVPRGWVAAQDPPPGTAVRRGRRVGVVVSQGPASIEVPGLTGGSARQAAGSLRRLGLQVGEMAGAGDGRADGGRVVASSPPAGAPVEPGARVHLLLESEDGGPFLVPDLAGRPAGAAARALAAAGLRVQPPVALDSLQPILGQEPPPGIWLPAGATVTLALDPGGAGDDNGDGGEPW